MKQILLVCYILFRALSAFAQQFNTHWISFPQPDSTSHVWFRKAYLQPGTPREAQITIASTGYYKLYVNEYNVGTASFYPLRKPNSNNAVTLSFDVTPYLRNDTNVIAIIYSPSYPHLNPRQISLIYSGRDSIGQYFSYHSDADWLCRRTNSSINKQGGERIDGRYHNTDWNTTSFEQALWLNAKEENVYQTAPNTVYNGFYPALKITRRRSYKYFDLVKDGVEYEFGEGFHGWIRLTLRNARKGQTIRFGNTEYICNGSLDEQACPVFSTSDYRRILISGDNSFQRDQIFDIEAISITPSTFF
ncbi:Alpha-L-rhamnosidase protein [Bacteroidales bacterium KA00344]|nr:Alpha-L-rhamnosidase protein [Bacteroidales bacterium KA00344]